MTRTFTCFVCVGILLAAGNLLAVSELVLADQGRNQCCIVVPGSASAPHRRAAQELSHYLGVSGTCVSPPIGANPRDSLIPIYVELLPGDKALRHPDAFRLTAGAGGLRLQAANEQALYLGVYRFLRHYAGMRWLTPGKDGEYCVSTRRIAVPFQSKVFLPSFPLRNLELNCANTSGMMTDTWDWMLRNGYTLSSAHGHVFTTKAWKPELGKALQLRACRVSDGKMFGALITGSRINPKAHYSEPIEMKKLYGMHPEYFPLVEGKRVFMRGYEQPCTSNPKVIARCSKHLAMHASKLAATGGKMSVINDDGTTWCQCPACRALDPAGERQKRFVSTRYWTFLNEIFKETMRKYPNVRPQGLAYQNFQTVPEGVTIDPRIIVGLSFNRRCFRHDLDDPTCPTNRAYLEYYRAWGKLPNLTYSREEFHAGVGKCYMPSELSLVAGFKTYKKLGIDGAHICTVPADGTYRPIYDDMITQGWYAEWQALYLAGEALWNLDADMESILEEANRLYYGPAWQGGMKEFRRLLTQACREAPGCFGWGHGNPPGRVLAKPGLPEKLLGLLDAAERSALAQKDHRALAHVKRDRHLFSISLLKFNRSYMRSFRDLTAYEVTTPITLDGKADEPDWKDANLVAGFLKFKGDEVNRPDQVADPQTFVRVLYNHDTIYLFLEAMEPKPDTVVTGKGKGQTPWGDDSLEIFLNHPNFNGRYYHFAFNRNGALYQAQTVLGSLQADTTITSNLELKSRVLPDRWAVEVKIPVQRLGQRCVTGHTWQLNVARNRKNQKDGRQQSGLAGGNFHGAFFPLSLAGKKVHDARGGKDTRMWQNGTFNDVFKKPNDKWAVGWNLGPQQLLARGWNLNTHGKQARWELVSHDGTPKDYYVRFADGNFYQRHLGRDAALRGVFRARGTGICKVMVFRFDRAKYPRHLGTELIKTIKLTPEAWTNYQVDYVKKDKQEAIGFVFWHDGPGEVCVDDVFVYGMEPPNGGR